MTAQYLTSTSKKMMRWLSLQATAIAILVVFGSTNANAEVGLAPTVPSATVVSPFEIEEYERIVGVPEAEARGHLEVQHRGLNIVTQLEDELGAHYAGVWFDNAKGKFVIPTIASADTPNIRATLATDALQEDFEIQPVASSWSDLERARKELDSALRNQVEEGVISTSINPESNSVTIYQAPGASAAQRLQAEKAGRVAQPRVEIQTSSPAGPHAEPLCRTETFGCNVPLRGGMGLYEGTGESVSGRAPACTMAFKAIGDNGGRYALTAGHCQADKKPTEPNEWSATDASGPKSGEHWVGEGTEQWSFPGGDWAKINSTGAPYWDISPWPTGLVIWPKITLNGPEWLSQPPQEDFREILGEGVSFVGLQVCHSGTASGSSCGLVTGINQPTEYGVNHATTFGPTCLERGDSGGPIYAGTTAYGILSGGDVESYPQCERPGIYTEISEAAHALDVNVGPGPPIAETGSVSSFEPRKANVSGTVDPNGLSTSYYFQYGSTIGYGHTTPAHNAGSGSASVAIDLPLEELVVLTTYHYRLVATSSAGTSIGKDRSFTQPPAPPIAFTQAPSAVKAHSATFHALLNPQGADTHYQFEYGTTLSYGTKVPVSAEDVGAGVEDLVVFSAASSLEANTTYHYRVVAWNSEGTTYGKDEEFRTPAKPAVATEAPSYTNTFEPQLNATVNPERADTHYQFEYGLTEAYGTKLPVAAEDIGSGSAGVAVAQTLKGLERSKTYHFRVVAENEVGVSYGSDKSFTTLPPCKGAEQKCLWSNQTPVDPAPIWEDEMKSVACASSTLCIAVGRDLYKKGSFVERWNGSTWSLLQSVSGEIKHVSCAPGTAFCVGVGTASGGGLQSWMIYEFFGAWRVEAVTPPNPSGGSEARFAGVSCTSSACTAVGSYKYASAYKTLVETWNGSSWSINSVPNPSEGSAQNAMLGVSCISAPTACVAVGEAASKPVAEGWAGAEWVRLPAPPLPNGATGGKFSSVSCASSVCIAVGSSHEAATGSEKALVETWNGSFWSILSSPYPSEAKGFVNLTGVSCTSSSACRAVGYYASKVSSGAPVETKTLAEVWNGSSWTIQSSPNASGEANNALLDVSCTSSSACTAAGTSSSVLFGAPRTLVERWNGSSWSIQVAVDPTSNAEDEMKGVSCGSTTMCLAVGWDVYRKVSFVERWNGSEWKYLENVSGEIKHISCAFGTAFCVGVGTAASGGLQSWMIYELSGIWHVEAVAPANPSGSSEAKLFGVSCTSTACTAVGSYKYESAYKPLVERWNGSSWSLQTAPNPAEGTAQNAMLGVSCVSASSCIAVGEAASKPVAERWNGSEWSPTPSPVLPVGAKGAKFAAISCGSATSCMAVGDSYESASGSEKSLVERWSGSTWTLLASPSPSDAKGFVNLTDVSCLSPNSCFAGGYYSSSLKEGVGSAENKTLVETWASNEWKVQSSTNAPGKAYSALFGISCTSSIACTAVGGASAAISSAPSLLAERYE